MPSSIQLANLVNALPLVSIVMPVRNEENHIGRSLRALAAQTYPHERIEVIIADGMSSDRTRDEVEKAKTNTDLSIRIVDNPEQIAPTGLNRAVGASKGEIIVRVDGHCEIADDYVSQCVRHLSEGNAEAVGGPITTIGESPVAQAIATAMSSRFGVGNSAFRTIQDRTLYVDTVAFPGYRREIFSRVGGFDEELVRNQDDEFNFRIKDHGGKILLSPHIRSLYYSRSNLRSLWRQYLQYGYWKVRVFQLHPKQMSLRQFVPPAFVSLVFFLLALSLIRVEFQWVFGVVLVVYGAAILAATLSCVPRNRVTALPLISLSFVILHFSYGIGFWMGLFSFLRRRRPGAAPRTSKVLP